MSRPRHWIQILNPILFILILISPAQADNGKKEVLPALLHVRNYNGDLRTGENPAILQ